MRILVTGASGFVGSLLGPRLQEEGHDVGAAARAPARVRPGAEVVRADVVTGEGLARAFDEIEVAYYLIHSMERAPVGGDNGGAQGPSSKPFEERERVAAERFANAAVAAGVRRIVY